jgi:hypothetical protein
MHCEALYLGVLVQANIPDAQVKQPPQPPILRVNEERVAL